MVVKGHDGPDEGVAGEMEQDLIQFWASRVGSPWPSPLSTVRAPTVGLSSRDLLIIEIMNWE